MDGTQAINADQRLGMRAGVLAGFTSWIVILGVVCACVGRADVLLPVVLPLLLASVGLALLVLLLAELAASHPAFAPRRATLVRAATLVAVGLLLLLADAWVSPLLEEDATLARITHMSRGVARLPRWLALAALAIGCASLARLLRRQGAPLPAD